MASRPELVKGLGPYAAISVVAGTMIGTAIFVVPGIMLHHLGSPGLVLLVWVLAGFFSLFGALGYAELGAAIPKAGGEYVYIYRSLGPLLAFLYGWVQFFVGKAGSIAAIAMGFMIYFGYFLPDLSVPIWKSSLGGLEFQLTGLQLGAALLIAFLSGVNILGVRHSGAVQTVFTASKLIVLALVVALAFSIGHGSFGNLTASVPTSANHGLVAALGLAMVSALWAYDGWNNLSMVAGEVSNPQHNIPRALIGGCFLVIAVYAVTNLAYFYVLTPAELAGTDKAAAEAAQRILGPAGGAFVAVGVMISAFATLNGSILSGSRIPFAQAQDGLFPRFLAEIHPRRHTPAWAISAQGVIAGLLALSGQYESLFTKVIFAEWLFYMLVTAGIFVLRRREPNLERPYRTWGYPVVPAIFVVLAGLLLVNTWIERRSDSLWGLVIVATGVPVFYMLRFRKNKITS